MPHILQCEQLQTKKPDGLAGPTKLSRHDAVLAVITPDQAARPV
jgi:hypothetical protein